MNKTSTKNKPVTYQQVMTSLGKGEISPAYFLFGEEKYLHDVLIDKIIDAVVDPASRDFNFDLFYANEVEIDKVINIAGSYPMMAQRRVVVVKDIHLFKPTAQKNLADFLAKPTPTTCLIITLPQKIRATKNIKTIADSSAAIDCRQLYDNEVPSWVVSYLRSKKIEIETNAIPLLQAQVGNSLLSLTNELEKVLVNIHPRNKITADDVQNVISISKQFNIFELNNAIGEKNFSLSIAILSKLLEQGENPTGMVIQISRHMANLLKIREATRMGKTSANELMKLTGLANFFINNMKNQTRKYSGDQLRHAFYHLTEADFHLKSGYQKPKLVMELLLYKILKG